MKTGITCLIPFYNEGQRLIRTLKVVTEVRGIDKIICVDDGSNDNSIKLLPKQFPKISIVRLPLNEGKTGAIRQGLKVIQSPYVFLLDADLQYLKSEELERAIDVIVHRSALDMLILQRVKEPFFVRMFRADTILSGQRIVKRRYLEAVLKENIAHYDLEVAMNEYAQKHYLKVSVFPITAVNTQRIDKWGLLQSAWSNLVMFARFVRYPGLVRLFKQILYFAKA